MSPSLAAPAAGVSSPRTDDPSAVLSEVSAAFSDADLDDGALWALIDRIQDLANGTADSATHRRALEVLTTVHGRVSLDPSGVFMARLSSTAPHTPIPRSLLTHVARTAPVEALEEMWSLPNARDLAADLDGRSDVVSNPVLFRKFTKFSPLWRFDHFFMDPATCGPIEDHLRMCHHQLLDSDEQLRVMADRIGSLFGYVVMEIPRVRKWVTDHAARLATSGSGTYLLRQMHELFRGDISALRSTVEHRDAFESAVLDAASALPEDRLGDLPAVEGVVAALLARRGVTFTASMAGFLRESALPSASDAAEVCAALVAS